jgi:uncharacterized metal-binding protein
MIGSKARQAKMVDLPQKKVGIVACSGEELAEGTVTRLAALRVLEELRPQTTATICLPLFLAGGEGDRAFARFYPTIAIDGCDQRCAARATEMYSGKPAASLVVTDVLERQGMDRPHGRRNLNAAGLLAVDEVAGQAALLVDEILEKRWSRRSGQFVSEGVSNELVVPVVATCSCGSGIPVQDVQVAGQRVTLVALPLIFQQMHAAGKMSSEATAAELLEMVKIYNPLPAGEEADYSRVILEEYAGFCRREAATL